MSTDSNSVMQDDMAVLLRLLGLGDHARPYSPHEVMVKEIIPAVGQLYRLCDGCDGRGFIHDADGMEDNCPKCGAFCRHVTKVQP